MAGEDRYKHPSNKKHVGGGSDGKAVEPAKKEAEKTASGSDGIDADVKRVGKESSDPGVMEGHDSTWGEVAKRHSNERKEVVDRHVTEMSDMHARHQTEMKKMGDRHAKEVGDLQDKSENKAESSLDKTAGSPKELGKDKHVDGNKGEEV